MERMDASDIARLQSQRPRAVFVAVARSGSGELIILAEGKSVSKLRVSMLKRGGGKWEIVQLRKPRPKGARIRSLTEMRIEYEAEEHERARAAREAAG